MVAVSITGIALMLVSMASALTSPSLHSNSDCTFTTYVAEPIFKGLTSTLYTTTKTTTRTYNCRGCDKIIIIPYGHIFAGQQLTPTTTVYASTATTITRAICDPLTKQYGNHVCQVKALTAPLGGKPKYNSTQNSTRCIDQVLVT